MITGTIKSQIDQVWNAFWAGGISNPLEVIEQITYLLFLRRLDDLHTLEENKSTRLKQPIVRRIFPKGKDPKGRPFDDLRWSRFKHFAPAEMFAVVDQHVFPFLRTLGGNGSTYAHHMKDARFTIPAPALLAKVVDLLDQVPMEIATPRATCTSTCSARSPRPDRTGSFARRATSSDSWWR
jgi:type I restriction enzyme M protein